MTTNRAPSTDPRLLSLYDRYADSRISRRGFIRGAAGVAAAGLSVPGWMLAAPIGATASQAATAGASQPMLDLAEWSYFFVGVERAELARGTYVNGKQMYVEYFIPAQVRHPFPMVLVHGGGGQGLDWMGTPDGRRGWVQILIEEGYKVYVVDRPGHGQSPYHPDLHGGWPGPQTLESISGLFTPQRAKAPAGGRGGFGNSANAKLHNQWPGTGEVGAPELTQLVASQGVSFGNGMGVIKDSPVRACQ